MSVPSSRRASRPAVDRLVDRGLLPPPVARLAVRALLRRRLRDLDRGGLEEAWEREQRWIAELREAPVAVESDAANREHYEVPPAYFARVLGPHRKYSAGLWEPGEGDEALGAAEERMLALTAARAGIGDGMSLLDLGCGWGSFTLYAAARFPKARVLAVSNSASQIATVTARAREAGLGNVEAVRANVSGWEPGRRFDRIVSVEMFEHMRNYRALLRRLAGWLAPGGRLFVHHFAHRAWSYPFVDEGASDWMSRRFFTGGQMPAADLLLAFQEDLRVERRWAVDGRHYARTLRAWRHRHERARAEVTELLGGGREGREAFHRWRLFYLACEELFGYRDGREWFVVQSLFRA